MRLLSSYLIFKVAQPCILLAANRCRLRFSSWYQVYLNSNLFSGGIIGNIPGFFLGMYFGSMMGKVLDMKGVCVHDAFMKLSKDKEQKCCLV